MKTLFAVVALAAALITAAPAYATRCAPAKALYDGLAKKYGEKPVVTVADSEKGILLVITMNPKTRSWTALTIKGPMGCMRLSGKGPLLMHKPKPGKPGEDA